MCVMAEWVTLGVVGRYSMYCRVNSQSGTCLPTR